MYTIRVKQHFDAAHNLVDYDGDCANLHGHRWEVEIFLQYHVLDKSGMAVDFKWVKDCLKSSLPDHQYLNEQFDFNPTAENIAHWLYTDLWSAFKEKLLKVRVWESPDCWCEYCE